MCQDILLYLLNYKLHFCPEYDFSFNLLQFCDVIARISMLFVLQGLTGGGDTRTGI